MPEQHARPAVERGPGRLGDQRGLAQTGLTRDEQHLAAFAAGDALERVQHRRHLGLAADHTRRRAHAPDGPAAGRPAPASATPSGSHTHLDGLDRIGQALQRELPERAALVTAAPAGHQPHDVGRQDLPALAAGTEPGRLDDRVAEVVVVLATDLAAAQPDPQTDRLLAAPVVAFDALLHRHRARQRRRRRREHDHEPVTQVLHLGAARLGDRLTQDREMPAAQLVRGVGRQARRQRGRTHHVGEQHRHVLGRHRRTYSRTHAATVSPHPRRSQGALGSGHLSSIKGRGPQSGLRTMRNVEDGRQPVSTKSAGQRHEHWVPAGGDGESACRRDSSAPVA